ncbi:MAG: nucleoside phosphorylase [Anaerolineales bacterium]
MSLPNFPDKYTGKAILTPQHMLAYRQGAGMLPKGAGPDAAILCLQRGLPERLKRRHPLRQIGRLNGDLFSLHKAPGNLAVLTNFGLGAPQMAGLAEELIAWGARKLISISMAGGLQADLAPGDIVVCDRALRDEGTSHHYLPAAKFVEANAELVASLSSGVKARKVPSIVGATWTTDATFRETDIEVRQYQSEGVKTVEMETAALFAVAQVRGIQAASIFVVGDSLAGGEWRAPQDLRLLDRSFDIVYDATIEALSDAAS